MIIWILNKFKLTTLHGGTIYIHSQLTHSQLELSPDWTDRDLVSSSKISLFLQFLPRGKLPTKRGRWYISRLSGRDNALCREMMEERRPRNTDIGEGQLSNSRQTIVCVYFRTNQFGERSTELACNVYQKKRQVLESKSIWVNSFVSIWTDSTTNPQYEHREKTQMIWCLGRNVITILPFCGYFCAQDGLHGPS